MSHELINVPHSSANRRTAPAPDSASDASATRKFKVLFLHPGSVPPHDDERRNMHAHLSRYCTGDVVTTRWTLPEDAVGPVQFDTLGDFSYHATRSTRLPPLIRTLWNVSYMFRKGLSLSRSRGSYDAIVSYGPYSLSIVGWILRSLTGSRLVVEVPGPPTEGFQFEPGVISRLKLFLARRIVPFLIRRADATRLYYGWQLDDLPTQDFPPAYVFPDFVPVSLVPPPDDDAAGSRYILFLGHPYNRKGVDVLIKAFNSIADRHPDVVLKIVGHCPDLTPWKRLAGDSPRVQFEKALPHHEAMRLMANCTIFALPSRMEGVPRVLIEALAARRAVASTRASGIPALIEHGRHGLLSDVDDVEGLAENLHRLLSDESLRMELGDNGHERVMAELTEERFIENFRSMMIDLTAA